MCGIAGVLKRAGERADPADLRRLADALAHRGPDDEGFHVDGPLGLAHRRLSILDLSAAGHQPMANEDETVWIVFNGEIYNFPELRKSLLSAGHQFRSRTDTEVLIHGYEEWGIDFVKRLNGIFAFALWDSRNGLLHLARDRYGVKPLYYWQKGPRVLFASEIKSLLCDPDLDREVDPEALLAYVRFRYCPEPLTLFKHVRRVAPGTVMTMGAETMSSSCFYELLFRDTHEP